jgi:hypothetical protein
MSLRLAFSGTCSAEITLMLPCAQFQTSQELLESLRVHISFSKPVEPHVASETSVMCPGLGALFCNVIQFRIHACGCVVRVLARHTVITNPLRRYKLINIRWR